MLVALDTRAIASVLLRPRAHRKSRNSRMSVAQFLLVSVVKARNLTQLPYSLSCGSTR